MAAIFGLSRSGYYKHLRNGLSKRETENLAVEAEIIRIFHEFREEYGAHRIKPELAKLGLVVSKRRINRLMAKNGLVTKARKKFKVTTTQSNKPYRVADNLLNQNLKVHAPNVAWVGDITYMRTEQGWLYVATVIDLFSRKVIGLAMSQRIKTDLVLRALNQAIKRRKPQSGLVIHSDRGSQYTSKAYWKFTQKHGLKVSMSGKGCCYDNAVAESFFHTLKLAVVHGQSYQTRDQATRCIFEYVECFYNLKRAHSTLNYLSPNEFELNYEQKMKQNHPKANCLLKC